MTSSEVVRIDTTSPTWAKSIDAWADYARALKVVEDARKEVEQPPWHKLGQAIVLAARAYEHAMDMAQKAFMEEGAKATQLYEKQMAAAVGGDDDHWED